MPRVSLAIGAVLCVALAAGLVLPNLGGYALWDPDEARHAEVAREVYTAGDWTGWILPHLNAKPYHDKPILYYWLVSASYARGGVNEGSARLVSATAMLLTVFAVYAWAARVWGMREAVAAAVVLVTSLEFIGLGRYASLDMLFTLWLTAGVLAVHWWTLDRRPAAALLFAGVMAGLGLLTKGLVAPLLIFGVPGLWLIGTRRFAHVFDSGFLWAGVAALVVALPWYGLVGVMDPQYLKVFLLQHHLGRFMGSARIALHPKPWWFYAPILVGGFLPWSTLLPAAIRRERGDHGVRFCLLWGLAILLFFSASRGKLGTYILPCFPALALVVGRYVAAAPSALTGDPTDRRWFRAGLWAIAGACLLVTPALLGLGLTKLSFATLPMSLHGLVLVPVGVAIILLLRRGREDLAPLAVATGMVATLLVFYLRIAPAISTFVSDAALVQAMSDPSAELLAYKIKPASLLFYHRAPIEVVATPEALQQRIAPDRLTFVVASEKHAKPLLAAGQLYPWTRPGTRHMLYATQPRDGAVPARPDVPPTALPPSEQAPSSTRVPALEAAPPSTGVPAPGTPPPSTVAPTPETTPPSTATPEVAPPSTAAPTPALSAPAPAAPAAGV